MSEIAKAGLTSTGESVAMITHDKEYVKYISSELSRFEKAINK